MKGKVSVEMVLNSRCSCDSDGDSKKNHWGAFIEEEPPSKGTIERVLRCCRTTPQFSDGNLLLWLEDKYLFLGFEATVDPVKNRLLHIESGMQQETVYLACTALGVGSCIHNLGIDGTEYGTKIATASHLILNNVESYREGRFTSTPPGPGKPFRKGKNLTLPRRNGETECLQALEQLTVSEEAGTNADETDLSQMLWAAKGRTPHYIKSHPWGLTIPTWGGGQDYTTVYLIEENRLFRYVNWTTPFLIEWTTRFLVRERWWLVGNPTHDVDLVGKASISSELDNAKAAIIMSRNEMTNRALWEVGYMLVNMFLQAKSLGISFKSKIFTRDETEALERSNAPGAVAAVLF